MPTTTNTGDMMVTEAVGRYGATLKGDAKQQQQQELNRFVRWFDGRPMSALTAQEVERYQEEFEKTGADSRRLEPVKQFLAFAHKQGFTDVNYGKFIRIKRSTVRAGARSNGPAKAEQVEMPSGEMLTAEGYKRLQDELDHLINVKRPEIARELFEARIDKDFRENAPFDAAKHHQAEVEARIRQLQAILARAQIIEEGGGASTAGKIGLGARVVLHDMTHDEDLEYTLVSPNEANPRAGRISVASPVGRALVDRAVGEVVDVEAPGGSIQYRIDKVEA
ncbi:MAG TPA: transcription elongation factor GreA [Chloroflexota bacterium]|nr:transcription elongation factor GreA [Chloroflexota bacterium]